MSHRSGGLYRLLAWPRAYEGFQRLFGARAARARFVAEFLRPWQGARLLDIGCGTGSLLDDLTPGVAYVGFDMNPAYIAAARRRYGDRGRFFCAAVGEDPAAGEAFDFVVARSLLHHLSDEDADRVIATARRVLRPGGVFLSSDNVFYEGQPWLSRTLIALDRGGRVRTAEGYRRLIAPHFADVDARLVTDMVRFPYAHYIMRAAR